MDQNYTYHCRGERRIHTRSSGIHSGEAQQPSGERQPLFRCSPAWETSS
jgi:hypothetical protein